MPTFDTPAPIAVTVTALTADVRFRATDRTDTVVGIAPSDPQDAEDVRAAEQTRVDHAGGTLTVAAPKPWSRFGVRRTGGAIDVTVDLPAGSEIRVTAPVLELHGQGRLGLCSVRTSAGGVTLQDCGPLDVSATGRIDVGHVDGAASVSGVGDVRIGSVDGALTVDNVNGDTRIDAVTGPVRARSANGGITIGTTGADVDAKTANGNVRVDEVVRGTVSLQTANGRIGIGIRPGTAARLDVRSDFGRVHNEIAAADGPDGADEIATVRARTHYGDVVVGRPQNALGDR